MSNFQWYLYPTPPPTTHPTLQPHPHTPHTHPHPPPPHPPRLNRKAPMYKCGVINYFTTKNVGSRLGDVPSHLHCILKKRLSTPFPQSNIAAAEWFTEFYDRFIEDKLCERSRCDFLSYTLFPQLDIDKYLGCSWSEFWVKGLILAESLLTPIKFLWTNCRHFADIFKSFFLCGR